MSVRSASSARGKMLRACSAVSGCDDGCCAVAADAASDSKMVKRMGRRLYQTGERCTVESGEQASQVANAELGLRRRGEQAAQVRGDRQVAALVQPVVLQAGPPAVNPASADAAAEDEGDAGVPVIGAVGAVLPDGAAEFGRRDQHHLRGAGAEIALEGGERFREPAQAVFQASRLRRMRVPAARIEATDPKPDISLDHLRELTERLRQRG